MRTTLYDNFRCRIPQIWVSEHFSWLVVWYQYVRASLKRYSLWFILKNSSFASRRAVGSQCNKFVYMRLNFNDVLALKSTRSICNSWSFDELLVLKELPSLQQLTESHWVEEPKHYLPSNCHGFLCMKYYSWFFLLCSHICMGSQRISIVSEGGDVYVLLQVWIWRGRFMQYES